MDELGRLLGGPWRYRAPAAFGGASPWLGVGYDDPAARQMMSLLADYCLAVAREAGDKRVYTPPEPPAPYCPVCDSAARHGLPPQDCCAQRAH